MKTREYEFEGRRYRWSLSATVGIVHQRQSIYDSRDWCLFNIPNTSATVEALAALIEDMQVQVIAEWAIGSMHWRARESEHDPILEFRWAESDVWVDALGTVEAMTFRAGYEAGKAAR